MARTKKKAQRSEADLRWRITLLDRIAGVSIVAIRYGALVVVAYLIMRTAEVLAGKTTLADIGIQFMANLTLSESISMFCGVSGVAYGLRQRSLRHSKTEYLQGRIRNLETSLDARRSSSKLTERGLSNPDDLA